MAEQDLVQVLNRIADEIAEHLLWMRQQDAKRTKIPAVEYKSQPLLAGQWPRRDGNIYGNVAKTELPENVYGPGITASKPDPTNANPETGNLRPLNFR